MTNDECPMTNEAEFICGILAAMRESSAESPTGEEEKVSKHGWPHPLTAPNSKGY
jgi:hypothetical protein